MQSFCGNALDHWSEFLKFNIQNKKKWTMIKFVFNHIFKGDRDNIYTCQTVGVTLTVASLLYSTVLTTSDLTLLQTVTSITLSWSVYVLRRYDSLPVLQKHGNLSIQPVSVFQLRLQWKCWTNIDPSPAPLLFPLYLKQTVKGTCMFLHFPS